MSSPSSAPEKSDDTSPASQLFEEKRVEVKDALLRYRISAYVTGVWLIILCVEMLIKYVFLSNSNDAPSWFIYIGMAHGLFYMFYLIFTADLGIKARWKLGEIVTTLLAGTVPLLSFIVEHFRTKQVREQWKL